jgi:hypothetical protein
MIGAFVLAASTATAAPVHEWSKRFGTAGSSTRGFGVASDPAGNVVFTGSFTGLVNFGGNDLGAQTTDVVLARYSTAGLHLWSKRLGGPAADQAYSVALDAAGNILVTGYFQQSAGFGGNTLSSNGANDIFVAKYDSNGNHLWSTSIGTPESDIGYCITADPSGNVIVTGYLHGVVRRHRQKYNAAGALQWIKIIGSTEGYDEGCRWRPLVPKRAGDWKLLGDGRLRRRSPLDPGDDWDAFVAKYDPSGHRGRRFSDVDLVGLSIKADAADNVLVAGYFAGTVSFGGDPLVSDGADVDIFLAKYDPDGSHQWSRRFGGTSYETPCGLAVDATSNVLLT